MAGSPRRDLVALAPRRIALVPLAELEAKARPIWARIQAVDATRGPDLFED